MFVIPIKRDSCFGSLGDQFGVSFNRGHEKRKEEYRQHHPDRYIVTAGDDAGIRTDDERQRDGEDIDDGIPFEIKRIEKMKEDKSQTQEEKR